MEYSLGLFSHVVARKFYMAFIGTCLILSCTSKDEAVPPAIDATQVAGSWQIIQITANPAVQSPTFGATTDILDLYRKLIGKDCVDPTRYEFSAGNTLRLTTSTDCQSKLNSIFGFSETTWHVDGQQLYVDGIYDSLPYTVIDQQPGKMTWQRTEYSSPIDGSTHTYTIALVKR